jgi:phosphatidylserine decarboxylase
VSPWQIRTTPSPSKMYDCLTVTLRSINDEVMKPGHVLARGDEIGHFEFGGSSIIVAFEPGHIDFNDDLLDVSKRQVEMSILVRDSLGKAK